MDEGTANKTESAVRAVVLFWQRPDFVYRFHTDEIPLIHTLT